MIMTRNANRQNLLCFAASGIMSLLFVMTLVATSPVTAQTEDKDRTLSADRPILKCPVEQKAAKNGENPDPELLKKLIRCHKGEKPAEKGFDGAVTVDITDLKIGKPRPWDYRRDIGNGDAKTKVFPIKVTYTVKTFYRDRTVVEADWIRIINFYVNAFDEWQNGSEEPVKSPDTASIPRKK